MLTDQTFNQLEETLPKVLNAGQVPFITGDPGVGKSTLWRNIAKRFNLKFIDIRLSTFDPTMFNGFLWMDPKTGKASFMPLDLFPLEGEALPINPENQKPYNGWLIHLDEFTQAPKSVEGAAFQLVLDHEVGPNKVHPKARLACSGNSVGAGTIAKQISTPMRSRLIHFSMKNDITSFTEAMIDLDFHPLVINYLNAYSDNLNNFRTNYKNPDGTYACERSWEMLSDFIKGVERMNDPDNPGQKLKITDSDLPTLVGTVGEEAGAGVYTFIKAYYACPDIALIAADPQGTMIPTLAVDQYAALAYLVAKITPNNGGAVATYLQRFSQEMQLIFARTLVRKNEAIFDQHFGFIKQHIIDYAI